MSIAEVKAMLEVKNVKKSFGGLQVLKGVSLSVNKGDVVAILGPSGSGKTTLLRCMNFLEMADEGQMTFDGEDFSMHSIPRRDIARLRKKTAFVFQNYNLFRNKTALQNVTEGLIIARRMPKAQAQEIGRQALDKVGPVRPVRLLPQSAFRRAAAEGGHRAGACHQPGDHLF